MQIIGYFIWLYRRYCISLHHLNILSGANIRKYVCVTHILSVKIMAKNRFRKYYDALPPKAAKAPKSAFVDEMAELCKVHPATVRCWIYGTQKPDALRRSIIAEHLGIPESELFD